MLLIGFLLGFVGYLPLGNINLTVVQLALSESDRKLWAYILFVALMEFVYCVACIAGLDILLHQPDWVKALEWSAVVLFMLLGALSLYHAAHTEKLSGFTSIKRGIFVAILNPLQIPFWLVWGVYLMQNHWVEHTNFSISLFGLATATGTIAILWLYAVGGKKLVEKLNMNHTRLNRLIGFLFIGLALLQVTKLIYRFF